jgi:hypothetical protein
LEKLEPGAIDKESIVITEVSKLSLKPDPFVAEPEDNMAGCNRGGLLSRGR